LVSDIPAGDGKIGNPFLQCITPWSEAGKTLQNLLWAASFHNRIQNSSGQFLQNFAPKLAFQLFPPIFAAKIRLKYTGGARRTHLLIIYADRYNFHPQGLIDEYTGFKISFLQQSSARYEDRKVKGA
jgi:hypothetical protein